MYVEVEIKLHQNFIKDGKEKKRAAAGWPGTDTLVHILHVLMFSYFSYPIGGMQCLV